jgi:large subunit ribosomal protein L30
MSKVKVTQVKSPIGQTGKHRGTLRALGLGRIGQTAEHVRTDQLEGQLRHVAHLVRVEAQGGN